MRAPSLVQVAVCLLTVLAVTCDASPAPASASMSAPPYTVIGSVDVFTDENTPFYWNNRMYLLENIACSYWGHAEQWFPQFTNKSYARIRELDSGFVLSNITSSAGWGFISAFPDYEHGRVWLFGTHANRCYGTGTGLNLVQAWWSSDLVHWETAPAFNLPFDTHNIQVTRVGPPLTPSGQPASPHDEWTFGEGLPPHRYAMILEPFHFAVNNATDGNLTSGWTVVDSTDPKAVIGGPCIRYSPADQYYYILTGGNIVELLRSKDLNSWEASTPSPWIRPTVNDSLVSPFAGFAAVAKVKGSPPLDQINQLPHKPFVPYWQDSPLSSWDLNSNDADVCCLHPNVSDKSYVLWGASTQGRAPGPPLDGHDAGVNVFGVADMSLEDLFAASFPSK